MAVSENGAARLATSIDTADRGCRADEPPKGEAHGAVFLLERLAFAVAVGSALQSASDCWRLLASASARHGGLRGF